MRPPTTGVILYDSPGFSGTSRHLAGTGWAAYSPAALGLDRVASVRVVNLTDPADLTTDDDGQAWAAETFLVRLYDRAPVYLATGEEARQHRLDVTEDLADTGEWAERTRYVVVASSRASEMGWGFGRTLAAGEPARYTLVEAQDARQTGQPAERAGEDSV